MRDVTPAQLERRYIGDCSTVEVRGVREAGEIQIVLHLPVRDAPRGVVVLTPDTFGQLAHDLAAVVERVQEAARIFQRALAEEARHA